MFAHPRARAVALLPNPLSLHPPIPQPNVPFRPTANRPLCHLPWLVTARRVRRPASTAALAPHLRLRALPDPASAVAKGTSPLPALPTPLTRLPNRLRPSRPVTSKPDPDNTEKLELPSISQVHSRGPVDAPWYNTQFTPRPTVSSERLPALPQIQSGANPSSNSSSPRGGSISSASAINSSASSHTSYSSSVNGSHSGFKTPSPEQTPQTLGRDPHSLNGQSQESPFAQQHQQSGYGYATDSYANMNQMQSYADVQQHHMPNPGHATSSGPPSTIGHYASYQQPPYLQPGPTNPMVQGYSYPSSYGNGMPPTPSTATMNNSLVPASLPLPGETTCFEPPLHGLALTRRSNVRWWPWLDRPRPARVRALSSV